MIYLFNMILIPFLRSWLGGQEEPKIITFGASLEAIKREHLWTKYSSQELEA